MMKKLLLTFLCVFSITLSQSQTFNDGVLEYTVIDATNNYVSVKMYNSCPTGVLVIPENVTDSSISYTVTEITNSGFKNCTNITNVSLPNSLTRIERAGFMGCGSLADIILPNGLIHLDREAFRDCTSLTDIIIPDGTTTIGIDVFRDCENLVNIFLPEGLTTLRQGVFYGCDSLTSIQLPNSLTSIGYICFYSCNNLTSIDLPDSITSIDGSAFANCNNLTNINIPESVTSMGTYVFQNCTSLTNVTVNWNTPLTVDPTIFDNVPINTIPLTVPSGTIPDYQAAVVWQDFGSFMELSLTDFQLSETIKIYPNPTSDFLKIELNNASELKTVVIYNHLGQIISEENTTQINVSNYAKGMYYAQIETSKGKSVKKFIVN